MEEENPKKEEITEEKKENPKEQEKSHNKIIIGFFIVIASFIVLFVVISLIIHAVNNFSYRGVNFEIDKNAMAGKTLYQTFIPVEQKDSVTGKVISNANYNFWLRNDPRKTDKEVPIVNGNIDFRPNIVFNLTENKTERGELLCGGDWIIAFQNAINLFQILGYHTSVINETTTYEPIENYTFINIQTGNSTDIEKILPSLDLGKNGEVETKNANSYNLNINNCEVLPGFEKLMLEAFAKYAEATKGT